MLRFRGCVISHLQKAACPVSAIIPSHASAFVIPIENKYTSQKDTITKHKRHTHQLQLFHDVGKQ
jgi:hypothetical protein